MLYCNFCKSLWKENTYASTGEQNFVRCPSINCTQAELIPVDDNIAVAIYLLNKHGFTTGYCCSGHVQSKTSGYGWVDTYIKFAHKIKIPQRIVNKYKNTINIEHGDDEPEGCTIVTIKSGITADITDYGKLIQHQIDIFRRCVIMLEFACDLCRLKRKKVGKCFTYEYTNERN